MSFVLCLLFAVQQDTVSFELKQNIVFVEVHVNGEGPFTFIFDNTLDMLKFFQRISLIDKLTGYDPTVSRATELLLAQEVIAKALAQPFVFEIGGEYLLGIAQKEGMS